MTIPHTHFDRLYINGEWVPPASGALEEVINPATEAVIGLAPVGDVADADAAITAARRAFDRGAWPNLPQAERTAFMRRMHSALMERADSLKTLMVAEGGFTLALAHAMNFARPMELFELALQRSLLPSIQTLPVGTSLNPFNPAGPALIGSGVVVREPVGVVTAITSY
ncbi:MAG: aldehyde dehydrogenase, partial [Polaromonas sp.]|nr:aldehyde dehydrogenase [Polaromonas sp.]